MLTTSAARLTVLAVLVVLVAALCAVLACHSRRAAIKEEDATAERFRCYAGSFDRKVYSPRNRNYERLHRYLLGCPRTAPSAAEKASKAACTPARCQTTLCDAKHPHPELCRNHGRLQQLVDAQPAYYDVSAPCDRPATPHQRARKRCPPPPRPTPFQRKEVAAAKCAKLDTLPVIDSAAAPPRHAPSPDQTRYRALTEALNRIQEDEAYRKDVARDTPSTF